jgi:outer membrane protein TolC
MKRSFLLLYGFLLLLNSFSFAQHTNNLDYYLNQALHNSPLLKDYQGQEQTNLLDSQKIRATYKPQVTGSTVNTYAPIIGGYGYDQAISNGGSFASLVSVNKTIVSQKNLDAQFETIKLRNASLKNTAAISAQELKRTVTAQYITVYGVMQQLDFNRDVYALLKKEEAILKTLTERNVYKQTDYLAFLVTLQQEGLLFKQLEIQFRNEYGTLNYLSGINDTTAVSLQEPHINLDQLPDIYHSIFFKQFEIDSLKLTNDRSVIDFSYKPKANLFADAGYISSLAYSPYKNFGTSFGFSIIVPIYDGQQRKLQYSKINIAERTRNAYKIFFTSQYRQQVAQLTQQLRATEELIGQINDQIKYSESLISVNGKLLETGDARISDYIIALDNYLNAKNLLTQNNITRLQIINQVNYWNR